MIRRNAAPPARGFTLIEILVVMVLIAITVSLASVKFHRDDRQVLRDEALKLAALLAHARDEAILTGAPIGWQAVDSGYRFVRRSLDRRWEEMGGDDTLRSRRLDGPVKLVGVDIIDPITGTRTGETADRAANNVIVFLPSAANRSFRIMLELNGTRMRIRSDPGTDIVVEDPSA